MPFMLIDYQTKDKEYSKYNGRVAITLGWSPDNNTPNKTRYIIITPLEAKDYPHYIRENYPIRDSWCSGNRINFQTESFGNGLTFDTTGMVKFTEYKPIKPPVSRWDKWGERKTFCWSNGRWIISGYEKKEEE